MIYHKAEQNLNRRRSGTALVAQPQWRIWSNLRGLCEKMPGVALTDVRKRQ
jgi:hypothetical protein